MTGIVSFHCNTKSKILILFISLKILKHRHVQSLYCCASGEPLVVSYWDPKSSVSIHPLQYQFYDSLQKSKDILKCFAVAWLPGSIQLASLKINISKPQVLLIANNNQV